MGKSYSKPAIQCMECGNRFSTSEKYIKHKEKHKAVSDYKTGLLKKKSGLMKKGG